MKNGVLKNFAKFTGKHLCGSLFINKVAQMFSCEFCKIFKNTYFEEHQSTTVDFWLSSKYASIISGNLLPNWLYLLSNDKPFACSCNSAFWYFVSCDRKKHPPEVVNNVFKNFAKFTGKLLVPKFLHISLIHKTWVNLINAEVATVGVQ